MEDASVVPAGTGCKSLRVIFGALGNLVREKKAPAIVNDLNTVPKAERWRYPILWADKVPVRDFAELLTARISASSPATLKLEAWADMLAHSTFRQVGEDGRELFATVVEFLRKHPKATVQFYLAVPYGANIEILEMAAEYLGGAGVGNRLFFFFEKPLEITAEALLRIRELIGKMDVPDDHVGIVEHFALKPFFEQAMCDDSQLAKLLKRIGQRRWRKVTHIVKEKVGTEQRVYDGIGVDSMINHHAFMHAVLFRFLFTWILQGTDKRKGALLAQVLCEIRRRMVLPSGKYLVCRDDHNPPQSKQQLTAGDVYVPTGIHLRYDVRLEDGEMVEVQSSHVKNTNEKVTKARIDGDGWSLELLMDGFREGIRGYGWRLKEEGRVVEEHFEALPIERACGYPEVARAVRTKQMEDFMPFDFQNCSNQLYMPLLLLLDRTHLGDRVWFDKGEDVLATIPAESLIPLHHTAEVMA